MRVHLLLLAYLTLTCIAAPLFGADPGLRLEYWDSRTADSYRTRASTFRPAEKTPDLWTLKSKALTTALLSPERLWSFLIDPTTTYDERLAAAAQGAAQFPAEFLPKLEFARGELEREQRMHYWGMRASMANAVSLDSMRSIDSLADIPPIEHFRQILGHFWLLPTKERDYPESWIEKRGAPWPWQVQEALNRLYGGMLNARHPVAWWRRWMDASLTMPWKTDEQAARFVGTTGIHSASLISTEVVTRWWKILMAPSLPEAARRVTFASEFLHGDLAHVMKIEALNSPHRQARQQAAYQLERLREPWRKPGRLLPVPATAILVTCRLALEPGDDSVWTNWKKLHYASDICAAVDNPPFPRLNNVNRVEPDSPQVARLLGEFRMWFQTEEMHLKALAEQEKPALDAARRTVGIPVR